MGEKDPVSLASEHLYTCNVSLRTTMRWCISSFEAILRYAPKQSWRSQDFELPSRETKASRGLGWNLSPNCDRLGPRSMQDLRGFWCGELVELRASPRCAPLAARRANRWGTFIFALRGAPLAGHFITFSLCLSVARIDTPPLQPAALAFVSYGFVLVRVRVRDAPKLQC